MYLGGSRAGFHPVCFAPNFTAKEQNGTLVRALCQVGSQDEFEAETVHKQQGKFRISRCTGGAISRALEGDSLSTIIQRAYWKSPKTAWQYVRLMDVVAPGSGKTEMVEEGVSSARFALSS